MLTLKKMPSSSNPSPDRLEAWSINCPEYCSGQFSIVNGRMRVSGLFRSSLVNEKSRVSTLVQKSVRNIVRLKNEFIKYAAGSTFLEINRKDTGRILISHPENKIQQEKIGRILATIDRNITHTEALIAKYQQIKAGLMHDLFTRGIGADGKLRPTREQAPDLYRESAIGWIPKEWMLRNLGQCGEIFNGTTPSRQVGSYWHGDIPWLSSGKVNDYIITTGTDQDFV
jgi:restriction endonuclease S subunit